MRLVQLADVAVGVEDPEFVGHAAIQAAAVHHHALIARRRQLRGDARAVDEVEVGAPEILLETERHLEAAAAHRCRVEGVPVEVDVFPVGPVTVARQRSASFLEVDVSGELALEAEAKDVEIVQVLVDVGIEPPPVERHLGAQVHVDVLAEDDHFAVPHEAALLGGLRPVLIAMQEGAKAAGEKNGVTITTAAGKSDGDTDTQVKAIEAAVARGDKGILITPTGPAVNSAIDNARAAGLYVIALDTPTDPPDVADITFATDNFAAGELIGKWAADQMDGKKATIAMLDLNNKQIVSVDYIRDQGFLTGMGIDVKDKAKNGDEDKTGKYTGERRRLRNRLQRADPWRPNWQDRDGEMPVEEQEHQSGLHDQRALRRWCRGGAQRRRSQGDDRVCRWRMQTGLKLVKDGTIGATSQQYPVKMAELGVEAIKTIADGGDKACKDPRSGVLRHRCRAGDRQEGRGRGEHQRRGRREALLGQVVMKN